LGDRDRMTKRLGDNIAGLSRKITCRIRTTHVRHTELLMCCVDTSIASMRTKSGHLQQCCRCCKCTQTRELLFPRPRSRQECGPTQ
jgi:hypothetical protein